MAQSRRYALILAGGRGTRFWPRSRTLMPKQLLNFLGDRSLLQQTVDRLAPLIPPDRIWVLTSSNLRTAIQKQLPEIPLNQILAEPDQRNTAPCLALAAQVIAETDPAAVLGVFPADHYITKPKRFRQFVAAAMKTAEGGKLVTLGIQPRWPETGYGYLEFAPDVQAGSLQSMPVKRFREKPDLKTAKNYVRSGRFFWNAGMFFWKASVFLDSFSSYCPATADLFRSLPPYGSRAFGKRLKETYKHAESVSVDYAVMEPASKHGQVAGFATDDFGWNDLGSWNAVYELDPAGAIRTPALMHHAQGCLVDAPGKTVALVGVSDLVVVDTPNALLIAQRNKAQEVGEVVKVLERQGRADLL